MERRGRTHRRTRRTDRGAAIVEFAFVGVLFFTLLLAIVSFGVLLAFKQNMTQAASESARASIAVVDDAATTTVDERKDVALASMQGAVSEFDRECFATVTCMVEIHDCSVEVDFAAAGITGQDRTTMVLPDATPANPCLTTRIEYENEGDGRILPPFPLISSFEPDRLVSDTTVRLVPVPQVTP